jgi:hypothetical protein
MVSHAHLVLPFSGRDGDKKAGQLVVELAGCYVSLGDF